MRADGWHLTDDIDDFLAAAGDFLRSRPARHTMELTVTEKMRTGEVAASRPEATQFGRLESGGEVRAAFYRRPSGRLTLTTLDPEQADTLAAHLARVGRPCSGIITDRETADAFAEAWQRHTGAKATPNGRLHLYRLATLTPPRTLADGRARIADERDHDHVLRWCSEFCTDVGEHTTREAIDAGAWRDTRFADKRFTFWQTADGTPAAMAGTTSMIAGMVRVDPVYTPAHLRGRGYAAAVTTEVSRSALTAGATDVVLFTDPANPTSNALYRRLGYVLVTDFAGYDFP